MVRAIALADLLLPLFELNGGRESETLLHLVLSPPCSEKPFLFLILPSSFYLPELYHRLPFISFCHASFLHFFLTFYLLSHNRTILLSHCLTIFTTNRDISLVPFLQLSCSLFWQVNAWSQYLAVPAHRPPQILMVCFGVDDTRGNLVLICWKSRGRYSKWYSSLFHPSS